MMKKSETGRLGSYTTASGALGFSDWVGGGRGGCVPLCGGIKCRPFLPARKRVETFAEEMKNGKTAVLVLRSLEDDCRCAFFVREVNANIRN